MDDGLRDNFGQAGETAQPMAGDWALSSGVAEFGRPELGQVVRGIAGYMDRQLNGIDNPSLTDIRRAAGQAINSNMGRWSRRFDITDVDTGIRPMTRGMAPGLEN